MREKNSSPLISDNKNFHQIFQLQNYSNEGIILIIKGQVSLFGSLWCIFYCFQKVFISRVG